MNQTLQLGPLAFPIALLLVMAALACGMFAGRSLGRRAGIDVEPLLWRLLAVGAVAARLAFVLQFHDAYLKAPLDILAVRDGGWTPLAGFAAATLYAIASGLRRAPLRSPLAAALGTGALVWAVGTLVLGALASSEVTRLPALRMQALGGQTVALSEFQGKPTVLNLWATWCPPCRREMPVLLQAQGERPDVNFVFLNQGESGPTVQAFLAAQRLPLRNVLLDARGEAGIQLGHRALPTTLFFDAQGRLVDTRVGELSPATLGQRLAALSPPSPTK
jgi:thiol-disulfide isomerase/thioredoxin